MKESNSLHELYHLKKELLLLQTEQNVTNKKERISEIQNIISSDRASDTICLGSVFEASLESGKRETFMLVESTSFNDSEQNFINLGSDFGNSVIGKRAGDHFSYQEDGNRKKGVIIKIIKNYQKIKK